MFVNKSIVGPLNYFMQSLYYFILNDFNMTDHYSSEQIKVCYVFYAFLPNRHSIDIPDIKCICFYLRVVIKFIRSNQGTTIRTVLYLCLFVCEPGYSP